VAKAVLIGAVPPLMLGEPRLHPLEDSTLKIYPGAPHGMCSTLKDQVNRDLLGFLKG
jgi:non-heme chloroperoxidase